MSTENRETEKKEQNFHFEKSELEGGFAKKLGSSLNMGAQQAMWLVVTVTSVLLTIVAALVFTLALHSQAGLTILFILLNVPLLICSIKINNFICIGFAILEIVFAIIGHNILEILPAVIFYSIFLTGIKVFCIKE